MEKERGLKKQLDAMRREHRGIEKALEAVERCDRKAEAWRQIFGAIEAARAHFANEERILFPRARQVLTERKLAQLTRRWVEVRGVAVL